LLLGEEGGDPPKKDGTFSPQGPSVRGGGGKIHGEKKGPSRWEREEESLTVAAGKKT